MKLKTKIITLALSPLLIATTTQLIMEGKSRTSATERQLERQHDRLLASGQQGVINMIDAANRVFQQYLDTPDVSDAKAMELALDAIRGMKYEDDNYVFVFDYSGLMLVSANASGENVPMWDTKDRHGNLMIQEMVDIAKTKGSGTYAYYWDNPATGNIEPKYSYIENVPGTDLIIGTGIYLSGLEEAMEEFSAIAKSDLYRDMRTNILISLFILIALGLLSARFVNRVMKPIEDTSDAMREIAEGEGDLTKRIDVKNRDEIGELATQFNNFAERMRVSLIEVRKNAYEVNGMSSEVATGSEELAARIEQAASNIQQTTASMEEITSTVGHTADSASEASKLAEHSATIAQEGADAMVEVETTMGGIKSSGEKISDIISMMDDIAFQTNILALNASVEAARAGEQGRGFSVVAQEVRNLAQRSAEASKDIRGLIEGTVRNTEQGSKIVSLAGEKMKEIVSSIEKVSQAVSEISTGTREQQAGIEQVNTAVTEMDSVTQENSTLIQQSAGAADSMRDTAQQLSKLVGSFILGNDEEVSSKPSPRSKNHTAGKSSVSQAGTKDSPAPKRSSVSSKTSTPPLDDDWSEF